MPASPSKSTPLADLRKAVENRRREKAKIEADLEQANASLRTAESRLAEAEFHHGMADDTYVQAAGKDMKQADREFRKTLIQPEDWASDVPYNCSDDFADFRLLEESVERQLDVFQAIVDDLTESEENEAEGLQLKAVSSVRLLACLSGQIAEWLAKPSDGINDDSFTTPPNPDVLPKLKFDDSVPCVEHYGGLEGSAALNEQKDELLELWLCLLEKDTDRDEVPAAARHHISPVLAQFGQELAGVLKSAADGSEFFGPAIEKLVLSQ